MRLLNKFRKFGRRILPYVVAPFVFLGSFGPSNSFVNSNELGKKDSLVFVNGQFDWSSYGPQPAESALKVEDKIEKKTESRFVENKLRKSRLTVDALEESSTIEPGKNIHEVLYNSDNGTVKVPEGEDREFFVKIGDKFYESSNLYDRGFILIPQEDIQEGGYVRFGTKGESFRAKIKFVDVDYLVNKKLGKDSGEVFVKGSDSESLEKVVAQSPVVKKDEKQNRGLENVLGETSSGVVNGSKLLASLGGVADVTGFEQVIRNSDSGLSDDQVDENLGNASKYALDMYNSGRTASEIVREGDYAFRDSSQVYEVIGDSLARGEQYSGKDFNKDGKVRFNEKLADQLFKQKRMTYRDAVRKMYWEQGMSEKEIADSLSNYSAKFEKDGKRMNISVKKIREMAGIFSHNEYLKNHKDIREKYNSSDFHQSLTGGERN